MPTTNPVQGFPVTLPQGGSRAQSAQADTRQESVTFDVHFQSAKAAPAPETQTAQAQGEDAPREGAPEMPQAPKEEGVVVPDIPQEADEETASVLVTLLMPAVTVWISDAPKEDALPADIAALPQGDAQTDTPIGNALQTTPDAKVMPELPAMKAQRDVNILEGPAAPAAETSPGPAYADVAHALAQGVTEDPVAEAMPLAEDAPARMPTAVPITSWEGERQDASGDPSSLENEDIRMETQAPPPSRVEITQVVTRQAQAGEVDVRSEPKDLSDGLPALSAAQAQQGERIQIPQEQEPGEAPPAQQIAREVQIQSAMGRTQFTMRLQPETLGEVAVRLTLTADGISARIVTQTESARQAIVNEIAVLGDSMRERGIDVRAVEVLSGAMGHASLLHDGRGGGGGQEPQRQGSRVIAGAIPSAEDVQEAQDLYAVDGLTESAGIEVRA